MVKPIDITHTVIVPKPQPLQEKSKSFFIGRVENDMVEPTTDIEVDTKDKIKQPHLDNSVVKDTEWKDLY